MEYFVIGADGQEYGPATVDSLRDWAQQNRVLPTTILKNALSGERVAAVAVPGIFPQTAAAPPNWAQPPSASPYPRPGAAGGNPGGYAPQPSSEGLGYLGWGICRSIIALVLFFFLHGIGLIVAGYGVVYAFRSYQEGHRFGLASLIISITTVVIIGIGWMLRLKGVAV